VTRRTSISEAPLPVRPRPHQGETADSCLRRLAAANHLRFSYLRRYLASPRGSYGPIDAAGLAVAAGRRPHAILRAFPELGPAALRQAKTGRRYTREEIQHAYAAKQQRYAVVRRDSGAGMSGRGDRAQASRRPPHHHQSTRLLRSARAKDPYPTLRTYVSSHRDSGA
jgi:hypothetical protein